MNKGAQLARRFGMTDSLKFAFYHLAYTATQCREYPKTSVVECMNRKALSHPDFLHCFPLSHRVPLHCGSFRTLVTGVKCSVASESEDALR